MFYPNFGSFKGIGRQEINYRWSCVQQPRGCLLVWTGFQSDVCIMSIKLFLLS